MAEMNKNLPVAKFASNISDALKNNKAVIVCADTGAGKTTQVPQILHEAFPDYEIIVTQPRVLAATSLAERVAQEMGAKVGGLVGYKTGNGSNVSRETELTFMTDGMLAVKTMIEGAPNKKHIVVIDEIHEWNTNQEILLAWLKKEQDTNPNVKLVIMSATMDATKLSGYLNNAPVIDIPGRTFPVEKLEPTKTSSDRFENIAADAKKMAESGRNVLVFMEGKPEIERIKEILLRQNPGAKVIVLHGESSKEDQIEAFKEYPQGSKIVIATNVAQTSITIPDITAVVDGGMQKTNKMVNGVETLIAESVSEADSTQRKGRAGRVQPGVYIDHGAAQKTPYPTPQIQREDLAKTALYVAAAGEKLENIKFFHQPEQQEINKAIEKIKSLGFINNEGIINKEGRDASRLPLSPELAKFILEAKKENILPIAIRAAALLEAGNIFGRDAEARRGLERSLPSSNSALEQQLRAFIHAENNGIRNNSAHSQGYHAKTLSEVYSLVNKIEGQLKSKNAAEINVAPKINKDTLNALAYCLAASHPEKLWKNTGGDFSNKNHEYVKASDKEIKPDGQLIYADIRRIAGISKKNDKPFSFTVLENSIPVDPDYLAKRAPHLVQEKSGYGSKTNVLNEKNEYVSQKEATINFNGFTVDLKQKIETPLIGEDLWKLYAKDKGLQPEGYLFESKATATEGSDSYALLRVAERQGGSAADQLHNAFSRYGIKDGPEKEFILNLFQNNLDKLPLPELRDSRDKPFTVNELDALFASKGIDLQKTNIVVNEIEDLFKKSNISSSRHDATEISTTVGSSNEKEKFHINLNKEPGKESIQVVVYTPEQNGYKPKNFPNQTSNEGFNLEFDALRLKGKGEKDFDARNPEEMRAAQKEHAVASIKGVALEVKLNNADGGITPEKEIALLEKTLEALPANLKSNPELINAILETYKKGENQTVNIAGEGYHTKLEVNFSPRASNDYITHGGNITAKIKIDSGPVPEADGQSARMQILYGAVVKESGLFEQGSKFFHEKNDTAIQGTVKGLFDPNVSLKGMQSEAINKTLHSVIQMAEDNPSLAGKLKDINVLTTLDDPDKVKKISGSSYRTDWGNVRSNPDYVVQITSGQEWLNKEGVEFAKQYKETLGKEVTLPILVRAAENNWTKSSLAEPTVLATIRSSEFLKDAPIDLNPENKRVTGASLLENIQKEVSSPELVKAVQRAVHTGESQMVLIPAKQAGIESTESRPILLEARPLLVVKDGQISPGFQVTTKGEVDYASGDRLSKSGSTEVFSVSPSIYRAIQDTQSSLGWLSRDIGDSSLLAGTAKQLQENKTPSEIIATLVKTEKVISLAEEKGINTSAAQALSREPQLLEKVKNFIEENGGRLAEGFKEMGSTLSLNVVTHAAKFHMSEAQVISAQKTLKSIQDSGFDQVLLDSRRVIPNWESTERPLVGGHKSQMDYVDRTISVEALKGVEITYAGERKPIEGSAISAHSIAIETGYMKPGEDRALNAPEFITKAQAQGVLDVERDFFKGKSIGLVDADDWGLKANTPQKDDGMGKGSSSNNGAGANKAAESAAPTDKLAALMDKFGGGRGQR